MTEMPAAPKSILKAYRPRSASVTLKKVSFNLQDDQNGSKQPSRNGTEHVMVIAPRNENGRSGDNNHEMNELGYGSPVHTCISNSESHNNIAPCVSSLLNEPKNNICQQSAEENQMGNASSEDIDAVSTSRNIVLIQPENQNRLPTNEIVVDNMNDGLTTGTDYVVNNTSSAVQNASNVLDQVLDEEMLLDGAESFKSNESYDERELLQEYEPIGHDIETAANGAEAIVSLIAKITLTFSKFSILDRN